LATLLVSSLPAARSAAPAAYDIIIRNGRVVDGTGKPAFKADVAIVGAHIAQIGDLRNVHARRVIDAQEQIVAPGFIDMLGQSESFLLMTRAG